MSSSATADAGGGFADLHALGFGRQASFEPLAGRLIGILGRTHVLVLRRDGTLFASARFRARPEPFTVAGQSGLVANAAGDAVAFTLTGGDDGSRGSGRETVYLLRTGDRSARALYSDGVRFAACERWATLAWHRDWLLYATTEGTTLALDSRHPARLVDLTRLVRRLATPDEQGKVAAQLAWAGSPSAGLTGS